MAVLYTPHYFQGIDNNGNPLAGGKLYTYEAGTTTPKATYTTEAATVEHANPIELDAYGREVVFIDGSYRFDLFDANDVLIRSTDNVTNFTTTGDAADAFFETFSGDGDTVLFNLSEDLGDDEKVVMIFTEFEYSTNGSFATDSDWTKGVGWSIGSGVATATGAISTELSQTVARPIVEGESYTVTFTATRSAGSVTVNVGGEAGTARSADGTYTETIIAGSTQVLSFTTSGFTGTVDDVSVVAVSGEESVSTSLYTLGGGAVTFSIPPAVGTNNIKVWAPSRLAGAAAASAAAAATSAAEAAGAAANLTPATSTTSTLIGTGTKTFTTQSGKTYVAGQWVLIDSDADGANYMHGQITSYSGTTLEVNVTNVGGAGTFTDWTITVSGTQGAKGDTGNIGDLGSLPTGTVGATDLLVFGDVSDSDATKTATVQDVLDLVPGSGMGVLLGSYTASSATSVDIGSGLDLDAAIDGTYDEYLIIVSNYVPATDNVNLHLRTSTDGGTTFDSGASDYNYFAMAGNAASATAGTANSSGAAQIILNSASGIGGAVGEASMFEIRMSGAATTNNTIFSISSTYLNASGQAGYYQGVASRSSAADVDALRFLASSGNIASGAFYLYGIKKS